MVANGSESRTQLDIETAWQKIQPFLGLKFSNYVPPADMTLMRRNKGRAGQLMEMAIGLNQGNWALDFTDGDLKTYKSDPNGSPRETMAITQVGNGIDNLVSRQPFDAANVHLKTKRMIVLAVCKDAADPADWFIANGWLVDARPGTNWYHSFKRSYEGLLDHFHQHLANDGKFHTSNGSFIQLRTKDSVPYKPLYSDLLQRQLVDKNIAFYFQKSFMNSLLNDKKWN